MYVYVYTGPVKVQLLTLAAAAISTTIIGSFLALQSVFDDVSVCVCMYISMPQLALLLLASFSLSSRFSMMLVCVCVHIL